MTFTVVLLFPDYATDDFGGQLDVRVIQAEDAGTACLIAQLKAEGDREGQVSAEDFRPILVLKGSAEVVMTSEQFEDWEGSRR